MPALNFATAFVFSPRSGGDDYNVDFSYLRRFRLVGDDYAVVFHTDNLTQVFAEITFVAIHSGNDFET